MNNRSVRDKFAGLVFGLDASSTDGNTWLDNAVKAIDEMAKDNVKAARLREELSTGTGHNSPEYRTGVETFIHELARNGDIQMAHDNALNAAGLRTTGAPRMLSLNRTNIWAKFTQTIKHNFFK